MKLEVNDSNSIGGVWEFEPKDMLDMDGVKFLRGSGKQGANLLTLALGPRSLESDRGLDMESCLANVFDVSNTETISLKNFIAVM
ncbi:MAG: hypothetical protein JST12_07860 [Armatimonadetes bacterium]|nr:hypothetical protein [Armatimonadota bacterium]